MCKYIKQLHNKSSQLKILKPVTEYILTGKQLVAYSTPHAVLFSTSHKLSAELLVSTVVPHPEMQHRCDQSRDTGQGIRAIRKLQ